MASQPPVPEVPSDVPIDPPVPSPTDPVPAAPSDPVLGEPNPFTEGP